MSTRGIIARKTPKGWIGRYHHYDSNPEWLGMTLYTLANGFFKGDLKKMMRVLTVEHTGWSTINDKDFQWPPQFISHDTIQHEVTQLFKANVPQCYCHGERNDEGWVVHPSDEPQEWAYVVDVQKGTMDVLWGNGPGKKWRYVQTVAFAQPEPDWAIVECGANLERCSHVKSYHDKTVCPGCNGDKHKATSGHSAEAMSYGDHAKCVPCNKLPEPLRTYYYADKHTNKKGWHCFDPKICDLCNGTGVQTLEQWALRKLINAELSRQYKAQKAAREAAEQVEEGSLVAQSA